MECSSNDEESIRNLKGVHVCKLSGLHALTIGSFAKRKKRNFR